MPAWGNCASTWNPASLPESARLACPPVCQRVSRSGPLRQRFPDLLVGLNRALDTTPCPLRPVERTLVLLKPDTTQRGLVGRILTRFEEKGLKLIGLKMRQFQIGRASCRESVWISVVAVSLKKKYCQPRSGNTPQYRLSIMRATHTLARRS